MFKWRRFCRKEDLVVHVLSRQLPCLSQGTHDLEAKRFPINMRGIPTRLIWVGSKDETQVRKLWFIMISRGKSIAWGWFRALHGFTALSFCWGCLSALSKGDTGRSTSNLKRWVGKIVSCDVDTQQLMFLRNNLGFTHCGWLFFLGGDVPKSLTKPSTTGGIDKLTVHFLRVTHFCSRQIFYASFRVLNGIFLALTSEFPAFFWGCLASGTQIVSWKVVFGENFI